MTSVFAVGTGVFNSELGMKGHLKDGATGPLRYPLEWKMDTDTTK